MERWPISSWLRCAIRSNQEITLHNGPESTLRIHDKISQSGSVESLRRLYMRAQIHHARRICEARWLGRVLYADGLELQQQAVDRVRDSEGREHLLLLEHPNV